MRLFSEAVNYIFGKSDRNKYYETFFKWVGESGTSYDVEGKTYIEEGFNVNPIVYSIISQMATKTSAVPYSIKKVKDKNQKSKRDFLLKATSYNLTPQQEIKRILLEEKSFSDEDLKMPLDRPNVMQTWVEFFELYKTFLKLTGNVFIYKQFPLEGANKNQPLAMYILPSHLMNIVLKEKANLLSVESPIEGYRLIEYDSFVTFRAEEITHIKYPNPNFDMSGSHLYGFSPLRAALKNIESSNKALDLNIKTMKNGGAFGLLHSKGQTPLTPDQAKGLKDRLQEMDKDTDRLGNIAGVSAEIGFTRLSMTADELKLFDYLDFDQKQICNVLGWSDKLLNNEAGAKYDNVNQFRKQTVTDNIIPDLNLFTQAFNEEILPKFKGYEGTCLEFNFSELAELQQDMSEMIRWIVPSVKDGLMSREEARKYMQLSPTEKTSMSEFTVASDVMTVEQSLEDFPNVLDG